MELTMAKNYYLRFVGYGAIPGIPGRDLTLDEIAKRNLDPAWLLSTKLWVKEDLKSEPDKPEPKPKKEGE
jgi:hypothetical protein